MKKTLAVLAAGLGLVTFNASATIVGITNVTDMANSVAGSNVLFYAGSDMAASFTTGTQGSTVTSVQLELGAIKAEPNTVSAQPRAVVAYDAYLFSDSGGAPGTQLLSLSSLTSSGDATFTPGSGTTKLAADTKYWLVLAVAATGEEGFWAYTTTLNGTSPDGWAISSGYDTGISSWAQGSSSETPLFSIETTPEPGTLALAGLGAAALGRFRRQR